MSAKKAILEKLKDIGTYLVELDKEIIKDPVKKDEVKLAQETFEDGTVIEAESFESGQAVFIVNEDERVALPIGEYTLADGRVLVVTEEGMIDSIGDAAEGDADADLESEFVTKKEFNSAIDDIKAMLSKEKDDNKSDLKKVEDDLVLAKEEAVKLQKEIDEIPDAKKIKVAPKKVELNNRPTTSRGRILETLNNLA